MPDLRTVVSVGDAPPEALELRRRVFIVEQGVEKLEEFDGHDPECIHFLLFHLDEVVGCARLRALDPARAKVERVAVTRQERLRGYGRRIMQAIEDEARRRGFSELLLHAQHRAVAFYQKLDWVTFGDAFREANIPHRKMRKKLGASPPGS